MKLNRILSTSSMLILLTISSCGKCDLTDPDKLNDADKQFMSMTSISNNAELDLAILAVSKSTNGSVKDFAQHMITEHSMAQTDLKILGSSVGYNINDSIDPPHKLVKAQLSILSGRQFDSSYIYAQVGDHQNVIRVFQDELSKGSDQDVKNYANKYLPHIQMHLASADSIATNLFAK